MKANEFENIVTFIVIAMAVLGYFRALAVNNYLRLKSGKQKEGILDFINKNTLNNIGGKLLIIIPFLKSSNIKEIETLRKRVNTSTFILYFLVLSLITLYYYNV